jgi:hypothetical protein
MITLNLPTSLYKQLVIYFNIMDLIFHKIFYLTSQKKYTSNYRLKNWNSPEHSNIVKHSNHPIPDFNTRKKYVLEGNELNQPMNRC